MLRTFHNKFKMKTQNKKAALELSIGTVVIIVIAMSMLILGLVLVRKIFSGATDSVDTLNDKVKAQITSIFAEEGSKVAIKLGADRNAKIKQGTDNFGIGIGGATQNGGSATAKHLKYKLELTNPNNQNCPNFGSYIKFHTFSAGVTTWYDFEDTLGDKGFTVLKFAIPDSAGICTQRIKMTTKDDDALESSSTIASASFTVQIISGGIFSS